MGAPVWAIPFGNSNQAMRTDHLGESGMPRVSVTCPRLPGMETIRIVNSLKLSSQKAGTSLWTDLKWCLGFFGVGGMQKHSMLGSGDNVWEWVPSNPGATRTHLALPNISRQVDVSVREQETFQSGFHAAPPPTLGMEMSEVVVDV